MICKRCGTEYEDHQPECPRCKFGRVKVRKKMPKWAVGLISSFGSVALVITAALLFVTLRFNDGWMDGIWRGADFYLTFNIEDGTCAFTDNGELVVGTYKADRDSFTLYTGEGVGYTYQYSKRSDYEMDLLYERDGETLSLFVSRKPLGEENTETEEEEEEEAPSIIPENNNSVLPTQKPNNDSSNNTQSGNKNPNYVTDDTPVQRPDFSDVPDTPMPDLEEPALALPMLYIDTQGGAQITSRENYVNTTVRLENAGKMNFGETAGRIRGRGNSTWLHFDKKPYRLKFNEKVDLLGMGANKDWVLLANAFDETMLRNYIAFSLGHELGLEYTSDFQYVHLYLNEEYRGVYMIAEQIEEGNSRVDVNSSKNGEVDTGYLIEAIGNVEKEEEERFFEVDEVDGKRPDADGKGFRFYVKSPDETECTDEQLAFIKDYVNQANEAIFKKDWEKICQLIDVDSMAKMFLVDQITLNNDQGYCFYLYKKAGGKLCFGPMWDYDQSCGGSSWGGIPHEAQCSGRSKVLREDHQQNVRSVGGPGSPDPHRSG